MFFKDIGKNASDVLTKDFQLNHQVEINSKPKGVEVKAVASYAGDSTKISIEPKYICDDWNAEVSGSVDTNNKLKVAASVKDKVVEGVKTSLEFTSTDVQQLNVGVEYKNTWGTAKADFEFPSNNKTAANFGAVVVKNEVAAGVEVRANLGPGNEPSVAYVNGGIQYRKPDFTGAFFVKSRGDAITLQGSYLHSLSCCQLAADAKYSVNDSKTTLAFGWLKKLNDGSTFKSLFTTDGNLSLSYKRDLSTCSSFTAGTRINTSNMTSQVGVKLNINMD